VIAHSPGAFAQKIFPVLSLKDFRGAFAQRFDTTGFSRVVLQL
jgi:hypothetical protein